MATGSMKQTIFQKLKYPSILLGAAIIAFGMYNIHARCAISEGGVLGLVLLLRHWFHISPGIGNFVIDVAAMVAGALILKKSYLWDSLVATIGFSVCYEVMSRFPPLLPDLSTQPVLAAILGGLFVGTGTILIVRHGCAAGADDTFALIVNHKTHIKLSTYYFLSDFTVLLLSLTYISPIRIWWSVLSVVVSSGMIAIFCPEPKAVSRPETK